MSERTVIDASVAIKLVIDEEFSTRADALYRDVAAAHHLLSAPPHLHSEVANGLYRRALRAGSNAISIEDARRALQWLLRLRFEVFAAPMLYEEAFTFASAHGLSSIYDSLYVVLAQRLDLELWTADRRLLSVVAASAPWVRWIGDYQS